MRRLVATSLLRLLRNPNRSTRRNPLLNFRPFSDCPGEFEPGSWQSVEGLVQCSANYAPLSPISFLERAARVYEDRVSVVYGQRKYTYGETHRRCVKLASALSRLGIGPGDTVATLAPNVPAMHELHFGVPMAGAMICTLNTRLDSHMISLLLRHSQAKIIFVDSQLHDLARGAFHILSKAGVNLPLVVLINEFDDESLPSDGEIYEYESLINTGSQEFEVLKPKNELDPISVNYTSGTTSRPKGVVYNHRGAYLNSLATVLLHGMGPMPVYLWTVPMFHCNGWCLIWGIAAQGGTNICLRKVTPKGIFDSILLHNVSHLGGAPTVLNMIVNSQPGERSPLPHRVDIVTGGSPPPPQILLKMEELGFRVSHLYGLTETYGPGTYCDWKPEWDSLPLPERSKLKARQGIQSICLENVDIKDPDTMESVPTDGETIGEVMFKGNTVMSGYLNDRRATEEAFKGGWFHSGDLAVKHRDKYIEVKDRMKDIIISGGENISTVEVETALYSHPSVLEAAVVARPDNHWGQVPCAFVKLKEGHVCDSKELIEHCRNHLPHYMAPRCIIFDDIPKTATGKIQKFILRQKAEAMGSL
uniref:4-coumarate--CoA ligase n=1 Tax=Kalanchoe fedtschenkoi TaxID=63787 RepID=A0A7N1A4E5_KALFE